MNETFLAFIITHGNLGECIKNVSNNLVPSPKTLIFYSNQKDTLSKIIEEIEKTIDVQKPDHIFFFVDLMGGSCWTIGNRLKKHYENAYVITGVNIPMIISYQMNIEKLNTDELVKKIVEDGKRGIVQI
ncbi:MAG: hypothetical protein GF313_06935 [Caldithrix sp.]|nr:hypothetical protein [Caldithrix sp.]